MYQSKTKTSSKLTAAGISVVAATGMLFPATVAIAADEDQQDSVEETASSISVVISESSDYDGEELVITFDASSVTDFDAWLEENAPDGYVLTAYSDEELTNQITSLNDISEGVTTIYLVVSASSDEAADDEAAVDEDSEIVTLDIFASLLFNDVEFEGANEAFATFLTEDIEAYLGGEVSEAPSITFTVYQTTDEFEDGGRDAVQYTLADGWSAVEDSEVTDETGTELSGGATQYSDSITINGTYNDQELNIQINTVYMVRDTWMVYYYDKDGIELGSYNVAYSQGILPEDWDYEDGITPIAYYLDQAFTEVVESTDYLTYASDNGETALFLFVDYEEYGDEAAETAADETDDETALTESTSLSQTGNSIAAVGIAAVTAICAGTVAFIRRRMSL